jgi:hypothetical protein
LVATVLVTIRSTRRQLRAYIVRQQGRSSIVRTVSVEVCTDPRGEDLRHALAQTGGIVDEKQCSPASGLPLGCCRIRSTLIGACSGIEVWDRSALARGPSR